MKHLRISKSGIQKLLLTFLGVVMLSSFVLHKYYLSLTEFNYIEESQTLQATSELFIDDLELALRENHNQEISLDQTKLDKDTEAVIAHYLAQKLKVLVNGELLTFDFLGTKFKDDKIVCFLEATEVPKIKTFEVTNKVLFEKFSKQQNVVKLTQNKVSKSVLLLKNNETESILLD